MATLNSGVRRFSNGGSITIDGDTVANFEDGTLAFSQKPRTRITLKSGGNLIGPFELDEQVQEISLSLHAGSQATNSIRAALLAAGSGGAPASFAVVVTIPDSRGAATGESYTWSATWLTDEGVPYVTGGEGGMDKISFTLNSKAAATFATY